MKPYRVFVPTYRELRRNRRAPRVEHSSFFIDSTDGVRLFCTLLNPVRSKAVVVAHPAVVGSYYTRVVGLAEEVSRSFCCMLFDFRGHGRSTGRLPLGFEKAAEDLDAVVSRVRRIGFDNIGVAGFSLGAAAAMLLASRKDVIGSLVSIGCPPSFPDTEPWMRRPRVVGAALRLLGARMQLAPDGGASPMDVAGSLPGLPKLLIFGEFETSPREEIEAFSRLVSGPKRVVRVPGAWHADLMGREPMVREWFEETL